MFFEAIGGILVCLIPLGVVVWFVTTRASRGRWRARRHSRDRFSESMRIICEDKHDDSQQGGHKFVPDLDEERDVRRKTDSLALASGSQRRIDTTNKALPTLESAATSPHTGAAIREQAAEPMTASRNRNKEAGGEDMAEPSGQTPRKGAPTQESANLTRDEVKEERARQKDMAHLRLIVVEFCAALTVLVIILCIALRMTVLVALIPLICLIGVLAWGFLSARRTHAWEEQVAESGVMDPDKRKNSRKKKTASSRASDSRRTAPATTSTMTTTASRRAETAATPQTGRARTAGTRTSGAHVVPVNPSGAIPSGQSPRGQKSRNQTGRQTATTVTRVPAPVAPNLAQPTTVVIHSTAGAQDSSPDLFDATRPLPAQRAPRIVPFPVAQPSSDDEREAAARRDAQRLAEDAQKARIHAEAERIRHSQRRPEPVAETPVENAQTAPNEPSGTDIMNTPIKAAQGADTLLSVHMAGTSESGAVLSAEIVSTRQVAHAEPRADSAFIEQIRRAAAAEEAEGREHAKRVNSDFRPANDTDGFDDVLPPTSESLSIGFESILTNRRTTRH